jgi:thiosulfate reductase cytochrome b subunit
LLLVGVMVLAGLFGGALLRRHRPAVRDRRVRWLTLLRQVWGDWARLTALGALALFVVVVIGLPILLVTGLISLFSPVIGAVIWVTA